MKKIVACLLLCVMLVSLFTACAKRDRNVGDTSGGENNATPPEEFVPVVRFLVASDVHFDDTPNIRDVKFAKMFENAYAYCDGHESYKKLDGAFFAGDIANHGYLTELQRFFTALDEHTRAETVTRAVLGNHEFYGGGKNTIPYFLQASGYETEDDHLVINGFHFIFLCPNKEGSGFGGEKQVYLSKELSAAKRDDPTGTKPIFVFQHHHVRGTVYGSAGTWGISDLFPVLSKCPQAVDFSGHSHFPINDPRSVWQGSFTALNTASLKGLEMDLIGIKTEMIYPMDEEGGWSGNTNDAHRADGGQYYIVEVDAWNRLLIRPFDIMSNGPAADPIFISSVGNPETFEYTVKKRAAAEEKPVFAENAAASAVAVSATSASFRFPRTANKTYVQNYRCEVYRDQTRAATVYRLDDGFLFPAPETLLLPLENLEPETTYTVRIVPVTSFANEGEPLTFTFTTAAAEE